ncbi:MAG: OB-fold domain-containing protein [Sneathiella sp.]
MKSTKTSKRPLPKPNIYMETQPFWDAAKNGDFLVQFCKDTDKAQWPPRPVSVYTGKRNLEWRVSTGKGKLYTWTNTLSAWPGHEDRLPYLCAMVELEEGIRVVTNLVDCDPETLFDGMALTLVWEKLNEDFFFPCFTPDLRVPFQRP